MKNINKLPLLPALLIIFSLYACVPQKEVTHTKKQLAQVDINLIGHQQKMQKLNEQRQQKENDNEISDTASYKIKKFIDKTNTQIAELVAKNKILIGDVSVNKEDWLALQKALSFSREQEKLIGDKVSLIAELINRNTVIELDQDVIFGPGQYTLSPDVSQMISKMFAPVAKEINYFINKYPDFPLSLVLTAKGYADATTINKSSNLYQKLADRMKLSGKTDFTNEELNQELSNARAESVINLLKTFTVGKSPDGTSVKNILYLFEGKGEKFPSP
ncbi:MAG: hypothetical protein KDB92_13705, partial [Chitinophagaceae bacterium]|nr:hypothetical protein [Chitinophagaceae bacterium]